jgi:hypothetical protein
MKISLDDMAYDRGKHSGIEVGDDQRQFALRVAEIIRERLGKDVRSSIEVLRISFFHRGIGHHSTYNLVLSLRAVICIPMFGVSHKSEVTNGEGDPCGPSEIAWPSYPAEITQRFLEQILKDFMWIRSELSRPTENFERKFHALERACMPTTANSSK